MRSTYKIASRISRSSCSGGRPKSRALPRRSKRQADSTGSTSSQRASDRSLGYGRRCAGMLLAYCPTRGCTQGAQQQRPKRTALNGRASWDETGTSPTPSHRSLHPTSQSQPQQQPHRCHRTMLQESVDTSASKMKTTSQKNIDTGSGDRSSCRVAPRATGTDYRRRTSDESVDRTRLTPGLRHAGQPETPRRIAD